jgi:ankyrin repeat protein
MDGVTDFREPVVSKATYVDPLDSRFNRQLRRRGAVLFAGERAKALANGLALAPHNAMIQMCVTHGSNPLFRAIYKNDLQLVALIAKQLSRVAINAEVWNDLLLCFAVEVHPQREWVCFQSHLGDLPLTLACRFGYRKIAEVLIDNGAEVNSESSRGL